MKVDVEFNPDKSLDFIITTDENENGLHMVYHISKPMKYGVDIWKQIRNTKTGNSHYEGSKMTERSGYNITVLFNENLGTSQHIRCCDGIIQFVMEIDRGNKTRYSLMSIKLPIEMCYDSLEKIISYVS